MTDIKLENSNDSSLDILADSTDHALQVGKQKLEAFIGHKIKMSVPKITIPTYLDESLNFEIGDFDRDGAKLSFEGNHRGGAFILFDSGNISDLISSVTGEDKTSPDFKEIHDDFLKEMGNIVLNGCVGTLSNNLVDKLVYTVPEICSGKIEDFIMKGFHGKQEEVCFIGIGLFNIESLSISGSITFSFYFDSIDEIA